MRLNLVAVWREATVFTEAERAALELTEQGARIADAATGVTDEAGANAANRLICAKLGGTNSTTQSHPPWRTAVQLLRPAPRDAGS